mmetsp:Transcript_68085/g.221691  ORF Transcript_68085/g.221691 Transcript_68085/m.221691 type:complete len:442 (-) Transcript_68085:369-1694(-)
MTCAQAEQRLKEGTGIAEEIDELVRYVDSLGFVKAMSSKRVAARRLWDNLMVLGMVNVILYHWFWYVLVEPRTYLFPGPGIPFGTTVSLPKIHVAPWVMILYRMMTQEWVNGVFVLAAVQAPTPEELRSFTQRDLATVAIYFYVGFFPYIVAAFVPAPWNGIVSKAETIERWFLLTIIIGKSYLVLAQRLGIPKTIQLAFLLAVFFLVPSCLWDFCGHGGELFLPTDWWPKCQSCFLTPKEVVCVLLYVGAAHAQPFERLQGFNPVAGSLLFVASCLLGFWAPGQAAIEFGAGSSTWAGHFARLSGLTLTLLQTFGLTAALAPLARRIHFQWAARWVLGSYIFNVNFLDILFLSPGARWSIAKELQVGGPAVSGLLTWAAMLIPLLFFMLVVAPIFQLVVLVWPLRAFACLGSFLLRLWRREVEGGKEGMMAEEWRQPLLA